MTQPNTELRADLKQRTEELLAQARELQKKPQNALAAKPNPTAWNTLECLEHLCRYGDFYLPEITKRLDSATKKTTTTFKAGLLGNYFAKMMLSSAKGMKTFNEMNPLGSSVRKDVVTEFIQQQETMLGILQRCADYDLTRVKTSISISNLIKLRLGDTLRVVIYHNQRHMAQAQRAITL
jgi:uncharacterized damage-inducible protein DinB